MKPLRFSQFWQRLAGFAAKGTFPFRGAEIGVNVQKEAHTSSKENASNCQNRYPSPSRWFDRSFPVGPSWFRRGIAEHRGIFPIVIAYQAVKTRSLAQGKTPNNIRGEKRCIRNFRSLRSCRSWDFRLAAKAQTLNALPLVVRLGALQATLFKKASVLLALQSAQVPVRWQTTSVTSELNCGHLPAWNSKQEAAWPWVGRLLCVEATCSRKS